MVGGMGRSKWSRDKVPDCSVSGPRFQFHRRQLRLSCVRGGYSHLVPSGHLPSFSFSWFCVPVYNVVFMARAASPRLFAATCPVAVLDPETSRDHLIN